MLLRAVGQHGRELDRSRLAAGKGFLHTLDGGFTVLGSDEVIHVTLENLLQITREGATEKQDAAAAIHAADVAVKPTHQSPQQSLLERGVETRKRSVDVPIRVVPTHGADANVGRTRWQSRG